MSAPALSGAFAVTFPVRDLAAIPYEAGLGTIGWVLVFHDPDGLEVHLYSRGGRPK